MDKYGLYTLVEQFYDENKYATKSERPALVAAFTGHLLAIGYVRIQLEGAAQHWRIKHPDIRRKASRQWSHSVLDVLADFLLNADQVAERSEDYPIYNAEKAYRDAASRRGAEESLYDQLPSAVFSEFPDVSAAELSEWLREIKERPEIFVAKYADGSAWSTSEPAKRRTYDNIYKAIRKIDLSRVKECAECGNGFYAHDRRRVVCDLMPHPSQAALSLCQYERDKKMARIRKAS